MDLGEIGGFSNAKYDEISPYFGLDPSAQGDDIALFQLDHVYIPMDLFEKVMTAMRFYQAQFGLLSDIFNETGVCHFFTMVCPPHVSLIHVDSRRIIDCFQWRINP